MKRKCSLLFLIACCTIKLGLAQAGPANPDAALTGTWKGTSLCQVKNSPCHDEIVVYRISKKTGLDTFYIDASKIVNGVEEEMGILPCIFNNKTNQLISNAYRGTWTFNLDKNKLEGTLVFNGALYRKILVTKTR